MKNNSRLRIVAVATLLVTAVTGMESVRAASLPVDIAVVAPGQTDVVSTDIAFKKKTRKKRKKAGAMKKTGGDAMGDNMKKPEGDAMKK
jgi:hypothetical protein